MNDHEWIIKCCSSPTKEHHLPPYVCFCFRSETVKHKQPQEGGNSQPTPTKLPARHEPFCSTCLKPGDVGRRTFHGRCHGKFCCCGGVGVKPPGAGPKCQMVREKRLKGRGGGGGGVVQFFIEGVWSLFLCLGGFEGLWLGDFLGARVGGTIGQRFVKIHAPTSWVYHWYL